MRIAKFIVVFGFLFINCFILSAQHNLKINADKAIANVSPTMWGLFFEDINLGADGGLYAELIKNRSFEFTKPLMGWSVRQKKPTEGAVIVLNRQTENTVNPRFIRICLNNAAKGDVGLTNEGFRGMGIKQGIHYDFSMLYRQQKSGIKLHIELVDSAGNSVGNRVVEPELAGKEWRTVAVSFTANKTVLKAKFNIWFEGDGQIDMDMISLFPSDTWKNRKGGMRADMVQLLADIKPGFIRFPGGCIVEGIDLKNRYRWKNTIGNLEERQLIMNRWNVEFNHRPTPDYFQTFGLGFFEYFQLAEDIGAEALPILNCGMACQYNTAELVPLEDLNPFIQDALDLIEFANGNMETQWGKVRAAMGHPQPFNLKVLGIGNENWGPQYIERLKLFMAAIKSKYPAIKLVCSSGTDPNGERFDYLNGELRNMNADLIDEHFYRKTDWFLTNAKRYDNYPRNGSKVFAGEYAAQSDKMVSTNNRNNWITALSEAAFMTGLERNADVVNMASYAPLFAHVDGWQWTPDLIWVNNLEANPTPNYYVQKLYGNNKGSKVVAITMNNENIAG
jgi:alpha-N-arabinofuranosidase